MDKIIKTTNSESTGIATSVAIKPKSRRKRKPAARPVEGVQSVQRGSRRKFEKNPHNSQYSYKQKFMLVCIELFCLGVTAVLAIMVLLGHSANRFSKEVIIAFHQGGWFQKDRSPRGGFIQDDPLDLSLVLHRNGQDQPTTPNAFS